jgi:hypothetical protein
VLVIFYGDNKSDWIHTDQLLDFGKHRKDTEASMKELVEDRKLTAGKLFSKAVQVRVCVCGGGVSCIMPVAWHMAGQVCHQPGH